MPEKPNYVVHCPYCGTTKLSGIDMCKGCGAEYRRRPNGLGWTMIVSVVLLPIYAALRWMAPDVVAPRRWNLR